MNKATGFGASARTFNTLKAKSVRRAGGQAVVEGTIMMVILTTTATLLTLLLLNTAVLGKYSYRMQAIASETARHMNAERWWLGMQRTNYNPDQAKIDAAKLINKELEMMGLPHASKIHIKYIPQQVEIPGSATIPITLIKIDIEVGALSAVSGGVFPNLITLKASGMSSDAQYAVPRNGMALLHFVDPSPRAPYEKVGIERAIRVPVYNVTNGREEAADPSGEWLTAGNSLSENFGKAYIKLECPNSGELRLVGGNRTKPWTGAARSPQI